MTRYLQCLLIGIVLAVVSSTAHAQQKSVTLYGEVVDPAGYLKEALHGPEAQETTYEAVDNGETLALLEDGSGRLFLFLSAEPGDDPSDLAYDYVNQSVKVTGLVYERGGMQGIVATNVEGIETNAEVEGK